MTVLFHGNFALNRDYMAGILDAATKDDDVTDKVLAEPFGYVCRVDFGLLRVAFGPKFVQFPCRDPVMDLFSGKRRFLSQDCGNCVSDRLVWHVSLAFQSQRSRLTKRGKLTKLLDRFGNGINHVIDLFQCVKPSQPEPDT